MSLGDTPGLVSLPGEALKGQGMPVNFDSSFDKHFPAEEPRKHQKKAVRVALEAFLEDDKDVLVIDAPPGFGKSVTIYTILRMLKGKSYYCTPLKALQEQLVEDEMMESGMVEIMGRSNYDCILPSAEPGTTVDVAKCQREDDFDCELKPQCPYYAQKNRARNAKIAVMNLAYMMSVPVTMVAGDGQFSPRDVMVIDECQGTDDWATNFVTVTVSDREIPKPVSKQIKWPDEELREDYDVMLEWLRDEVLPTARDTAEYMAEQAIKDKDELTILEVINEFISKVERFLGDEKEHHWELTYDVDINKNADNNRRAVFEPIKPGRFLDDFLWSSTDKIILSSATVPKDSWFKEIGLEDKERVRLNIPSEFPVENRPIVVDEAVGKMTKDEREENIVPMVKKIKQISEHHDGEKGIVHCRGYNYIQMFKRACTNNGLMQWYNDNIHIQDQDRREESLEEWVQGDKQIFLSVNMAEGIDLDGDKCRWQVLLKCLYPSLNSKRVSFRLNHLFVCNVCGHEVVDRESDELDECPNCGRAHISNDWDWYNQKAVTQIEQAYGRAVRGPEDHAVFYLLDSSAKTLMKYNDRLFHDWFLEAVQ